MRNKIAFILITGIAIISLGLSLSGCSKKIVGDANKDDITISMSAKISDLEKSSLIEQFLLTVEAGDFTDPVVVPMELDGAYLVGEVEVPAGLNRHFIVQAMDIEGTVIYQGDAYADVIYNSTVNVNIDLVPLVPLMKIVPRSMSAAMNEPFTIDILVYNTPDVRYVSFDVSYASKDNLVGVFDVTAGKDLPQDTRLSFVGGNAQVSVWMDRADQTGSLVNENGYANLATIYFNTYFSETLDYDTANLEITPISLDRGTGDFLDPFPLDSLYLEESVIELYKIPGN